jgi:hypothetical protein
MHSRAIWAIWAFYLENISCQFTKMSNIWYPCQIITEVLLLTHMLSLNSTVIRVMAWLSARQILHFIWTCLCEQAIIPMFVLWSDIAKVVLIWWCSMASWRHVRCKICLFWPNQNKSYSSHRLLVHYQWYISMLNMFY